MYGKLFSQMYDGTLATTGPWQALVTFQQLVILADQRGHVDMTAEAVARRTTIPLEVIQTGIQALQEPDPDSRSPDENGRRIVPIDPDRSWGWRIVNHAHYRKIRSEEERREYHREYARRRRANPKQDTNVTLTSTNQPAVDKVTHAVSSKQEAVSSKQEKPPTVGGVVKSRKPALASSGPDAAFLAAWDAYPRRPGDSRTKACRAWCARVRVGISPEALLAGVRVYAPWIEHERQRDDWQPIFIKSAATFFGPDRHWESDWTVQDSGSEMVMVYDEHHNFTPEFKKGIGWKPEWDR